MAGALEGDIFIGKKAEVSFIQILYAIILGRIPWHVQKILQCHMSIPGMGKKGC